MDTNELGNSIKLRKNGGFTHFRYTSSKIGFCWSAKVGISAICHYCFKSPQLLGMIKRDKAWGQLHVLPVRILWFSTKNLMFPCEILIFAGIRQMRYVAESLPTATSVLLQAVGGAV
jgi:hypothetical protein